MGILRISRAWVVPMAPSATICIIQLDTFKLDEWRVFVLPLFATLIGRGDIR
jgi:hypothetical protein